MHLSKAHLLTFMPGATPTKLLSFQASSLSAIEFCEKITLFKYPPDIHPSCCISCNIKGKTGLDLNFGTLMFKMQIQTGCMPTKNTPLALFNVTNTNVQIYRSTPSHVSTLTNFLVLFWSPLSLSNNKSINRVKQQRFNL